MIRLWCLVCGSWIVGFCRVYGCVGEILGFVGRCGYCGCLGGRCFRWCVGLGC